MRENEEVESRERVRIENEGSGYHRREGVPCYESNGMIVVLLDRGGFVPFMASELVGVRELDRQKNA